MFNFTWTVSVQFFGISLINQSVLIAGHKNNCGIFTQIHDCFLYIQILNVILCFFPYIFLQLCEHTGEEAVYHEIGHYGRRVFFSHLLAQTFEGFEGRVSDDELSLAVQ